MPTLHPLAFQNELFLQLDPRVMFNGEKLHVVPTVTEVVHIYGLHHLIDLWRFEIRSRKADVEKQVIKHLRTALLDVALVVWFFFRILQQVFHSELFIDWVQSELVGITCTQKEEIRKYIALYWLMTHTRHPNCACNYIA